MDMLSPIRMWLLTQEDAMHRRRFRMATGMTLVEVLVSCVLLSLGLIALSQLYLASMWMHQDAKYLAVATHRAQFELERVNSLGFYALDNGPSASSFPPISVNGRYTHLAVHQGVAGVSFAVDGLPGGHGTITWSHYPANTVGNEHLLQVTVNVTWTTRQQRPAGVTLTTLFVNQ